MHRRKFQTLNLKTNNRTTKPNSLNLLFPMKPSQLLSLQKNHQSRLDQQKPAALKESEISRELSKLKSKLQLLTELLPKNQPRPQKAKRGTFLGELLMRSSTISFYSTILAPKAKLLTFHNLRVTIMTKQTLMRLLLLLWGKITRKRRKAQWKAPIGSNTLMKSFLWQDSPTKMRFRSLIRTSWLWNSEQKRR